MRKQLIPTLAILFFIRLGASPSQAQAPPQSIDLPNSKLLLAVPGDPRAVNSMPTACALSPDGKTLAFVHTGYGYEKNGGMQSITLLDVATGTLAEHNEPMLGKKALRSLSFGVAWSGDAKRLYVSVGSISRAAENVVLVYGVKGNQLAIEREIPLPAVKLDAGRRAFPLSKNLPETQQVSFPAGIARFQQNGREKLLVAEDLSDTAAVVDAESGRLEAQVVLGEEKRVPAAYPYAAVVDAAAMRGYVSLWNSSAVVEINLETAKVMRRFALLKPEQATEAGSHPTALALDDARHVLYVALANRDQIAAIDLANGKVRYGSTAAQEQQFAGSYPDALALSGDGQTLYAANAGANDVAVLDVSGASMRMRGLVPTEWYPTALAFAQEKLIVGSGKSTGTGPNGAPYAKSKRYIAGLLHGSIAIVPAALIASELPHLTAQASASNRYKEAQRLSFSSGKNPIRHVIYILKENRTYDQVFGDIKEANGDPGLVMFGEKVTPNQHALARQFGVLDNFYDSGEVSGNGHVWSTAAITSDYTEKIWPIDYRGEERTYDFEGSVANAIPFREGIADVDEPGTGYLWGNLARHGRSFRHYGEFVMSVWCGEKPEAALPTEGTPIEATQQCARNAVYKGEMLPDAGDAQGSAPSPYPWPVPVLAANINTKPELAGHFDPRAADFNLSYPDQLRADEFLREFRGFVTARKSGTGETLPDFVLLRLPNDHTSGTKPGAPSPRAAVADNDLAVGRVVDAVSHSPYWEDTAIFVIEDDAQDGADHVDAHRSTALVISKYAPQRKGERPFVESGFFTTVNLIHTMEAVLELPPMNANDAYAPLMGDMFSGAGTQPPFAADFRNRENGMLYEVNAADAIGAKQSAKLDFSRADAADATTLNAVLWKSMMGNRRMPRPVHAVIPVSVRDER